MRITNEVHMMWDDAVLTIAPSSGSLEKFLTYKEKVLEPHPQRPWERVSRVKVRPLFQIIHEQAGYRVVQTMQGLWNRVKAFLEKEGHTVKFYDMRLPFPEPKFNLMTGFRFSQEALVRQFLSTKCSGLLGAPTRYGKTCCIKNTLRAFPHLTTVVTAPGADLIKQLYDDIKDFIPGRAVVLIGAGSSRKQSCDDINVVSMDSLHKCDADKVRLVLIDEPHACVTDSRLPELVKFDKARKFGFGATLTGRFDQRDILVEALIGPVLAERTFREAVAEGAVCPMVVFMIRIPISIKCDNRDRAYKKLLFQNERIGKTVKWICHTLLPQDWQSLIFIKNEAEAEFFLDWVGEAGTIAMAKRLTKKEREELMVRMCSDEIKRCLASDIYSQGVTFNHVRAMINLSGGGASTSTIQKPGRLAETRPGKKCGVVFDFMFIPSTTTSDLGNSMCLVRESAARAEAYTNKGYDIIYVDSYNELEAKFKEKAI